MHPCQHEPRWAQAFRAPRAPHGPGDKLGLLGGNGSGKSTLLKLFTGELEPDSGTIKRADMLQVVTFDQHREQLDLKQTLRYALTGGGDFVQTKGSPSHVAGWAKRFLFTSEQLDMPLSKFSGGEQSRVLIARLMLQPADLLLLDEPTNDLDIPSLEVLEQSLLEFSGALVLVTHDRYLLDRVSQQVLALDGKGHAELFADFVRSGRISKQMKAPRAGRPKRRRPPLPGARSYRGRRLPLPRKWPLHQRAQ